MIDARADWLYRRAQPGVIRAFAFDDPGELGPTGSWINKPTGHQGPVTLDPAIRFGGAQSLRFVIPSQDAGGGQQWGFRLSDHNQLQIRAGQSLYVQWRQRTNAVLAQTTYYEGGSGGASGAGAFQLNDVKLPQIPARYVNATTFEVDGDIFATMKPLALKYAGHNLTTLKGFAARAFLSTNTKAPFSTYAYGKVASWTYDATTNTSKVVLDISNGHPEAAIPLSPQLNVAQICVTSGGVQGGRKLIDATQGPILPGGTDPGTSPNTKLVIISNADRVPIMYTGPQDAGMYPNQAGKRYLQSAYSADGSGNLTCLYPFKRGTCFIEPADVDTTYQLGIELLDVATTSAGAAFWNVRARLWVQLDDDPAVLVHDWHSGVPGYEPAGFGSQPGRMYAGLLTQNIGLGKVNAFPYFTNKAHDQTTGVGQVNYGDFIASTQRIPDFGASRIVVSVPPTEEGSMDFTTALQKCKDAYDGVAALAQTPTIDQQIAAATAAGAAQQATTDQQAIADANAARDAAIAAQQATQTKLDQENADIDAAQAKAKGA
jgi:hypothetical protein